MGSISAVEAKLSMIWTTIGMKSTADILEWSHLLLSHFLKLSLALLGMVGSLLLDCLIAASTWLFPFMAPFLCNLLFPLSSLGPLIPGSLELLIFRWPFFCSEDFFGLGNSKLHPFLSCLGSGSDFLANSLSLGGLSWPVDIFRFGGSLAFSERFSCISSVMVSTLLRGGFLDTLSSSEPLSSLPTMSCSSSVSESDTWSFVRFAS